MKKKAVSIFLAIIMVLSPVVSFAELDVTCKSALLMDFNTGNVIFAQNEHEKLPPASVTKIMTLLLAMEAIDSGKLKMDDKIVVSQYASSMGGTQVYLEQGEVQIVEDLIRAVSIRSANDAAVALGEGISGTNEGFINLMNERAKSIGMNNTNFVNSSGLPVENHYTTAYDVALMSRELMKHSSIEKHLTTYMEDILVGKGKDDTQVMVNTNKLIRDYEGTTGIKTGSTNEAKYCVSASAKRGDLHLIAVILGAETSAVRFNEAIKLLDYGFANYDSIPIGKKGEIIAKVPIEKADMMSLELILERDYFALVPKGNSGNITKEVSCEEDIKSPIKQGDVLGSLTVLLDNKVIKKVNLVAKSDVENADLFLLLKRTFESFITGS
ncbi:MAG: D-alanyl-D-alanine carboxypeptidase [Tissierellia bacterium]|nr:D-alanyl-D-alanine carboxypeptidase [Tissierellia bacterium]MDD4726168.1 D-alanyl-D-alanine carboxypeptidase [Tissierellia bacterium]